jgi:hypothetical protein
VTKVRIFTLDDLSNGVEPASQRRDRPAHAEETGENVVTRRKREETQSRHHAFLRQTVPPSDPIVREMERRRSGGGDTE